MAEKHERCGGEHETEAERRACEASPEPVRDAAITQLASAVEDLTTAVQQAAEALPVRKRDTALRRWRQKLSEKISKKS